MKQVTAGRPDLRLVPAAVATWMGALAGVAVSRPALVGICLGGVTALVIIRLGVARPARLAALVALACFLGGTLAGAARAAVLRAGPVDELADDHAVIRVDATVVTDPQPRPAEGGRAAYVVADLRIERVTGRGITTAVRTPVVLLTTSPDWETLRPGQRVSATGRLAPAERSSGIAAVLRVGGPPEVRGPPGLPSRLTEPLRAGLRAAVDGLADGPRGLLPALVVGDESRLPAALRADMEATGLTHLTAVSGTNVTIVLLAVVSCARWLGIRGYGLPIVGALTIVGFVLLARPEPSVLRAAAMGLIAVAGLTVAGRRRGPPALAAAVIVLLLADPWLGRTAGFALSVLATGAILVLAPVWRESLHWLPRPLAEALAVPLAAQLACAPVVVALAAQASLVSVPANLVVAPVVAPATVLGVAAAVAAPIVPPAAGAVGWLAGLPASWIVVVARHGADLPGAVVNWPSGAVGVVAAAVVAVAVAAVLPRLLRRPRWFVTTSVLLTVTVLVRPPVPGWPPPEWVIVACDVGQGDALALRAGPAAAVVVDAGPDPPSVDRCLDSLGVEWVPLLVLTHHHADHVVGLPGVLEGRRVGQALVSPLAEPADLATEVRSSLAQAGVPVAVARAGAEIAVGDDLRLRVIWPRRIITDGSAPNNASIVLDAWVDGVHALLAGDVEPEAQRAILGAEPDLRADVLKVPHHGSAHQDADLLTGLGARVALVSSGAGNSHGHPAADTVDLLAESGMRVVRTDHDGSVAVVHADGRIGVATGGPRSARPRGRPVRAACNPGPRCPSRPCHRRR